MSELSEPVGMLCLSSALALILAKSSCRFGSTTARRTTRFAVGKGGSGRIDVCAGIGGGGLWCGGGTKCASSKHDDLEVWGARSACESACASGNASTMCWACFERRGDASAGICGKKSSRGVGVGGVGCQSACTCAGVTGTTLTIGRHSSIGGNAGAACGGTWNDGGASVG